MSFKSLRLPALMAGAAAVAVSFATPAFAWYHHARDHYRTAHHVVYRTVYRPAPGYAWAPGAAAANVVGGAGVAAVDVAGGAGALAGDIVGGALGTTAELAFPYNCGYGYPSPAYPGAYCPPHGYYAPATYSYGYPYGYPVFAYGYGWRDYGWR